MAFDDELADLLEETANRVDTWTGHDAWTWEPGSPASVEVANTETRSGGTPWGDRPVRSVYQLAQMATKYTVEMARCIVPLVHARRPAPGIETLARTSLEAASVVWWLLEEGLTARQRVCRMQLLRRNSANELAKNIAAVGASPSVAGNETAAAIEIECQALGLAAFGQGGDELEGDTRLRYTKRVEKFTGDIGYERAYNIYSGVAHAELVGLWRLVWADRDAPGRSITGLWTRCQSGSHVCSSGRSPEVDVGADGADRSVVQLDCSRTIRRGWIDDRSHQQRLGPIAPVGEAAHAASSSAAGSKARRMVAADFWMRSQDVLIPAMAWSPPPAQVATYPKE